MFWNYWIEIDTDKAKINVEEQALKLCLLKRKGDENIIIKPG